MEMLYQSLEEEMPILDENDKQNSYSVPNSKLVSKDNRNQK